MDREISIVRYLKKLLDNVWLIILLTAICGALLYSYSAFLATPMYTSTAKMLASNRNTDLPQSGNISSSDMNARSSLVKTYAQIIKSNTLMSKVCDKIDMYREVSGYEFLRDSAHSPAALARKIKVEAIDETEVFNISLTLDDPLEAQFIVNAIAENLPSLVDEKMQSSSVSLIDPADLPTKPSSPNTFKNTSIGAVIGFLAAAAIIFVITITDTVIHNEEDLTESFENITLLGTIPLIFSDTEKTAADTKQQK